MQESAIVRGTLIIKNTYKINMFFEMIILKVLYIYVISVYLPDMWELWSVDKNINYYNVFIEFIPFLSILIIYLYTYKRGSGLSFLSTLLFVMYFIPNNSCLTISCYDIEYYTLNSIYSMLVFIAIGFFDMRGSYDSNVNEIDQNFIWENRKMIRIMSAICVIVCIVCIVYVYIYNGLNFSFLFGDMYTTRALFADYYAAHVGSIVSYAILIVTSVFNWFLPICLYFSICSKKITYVVLCTFTYLALYTVQQTKATLFTYALVLLICYITRKKSVVKIGEVFIWAFIVVFVICILEEKVLGSSVVFIFLRRLLYIPQYLVHIFYEFYSSNPKLWFTQDAFFIQKIMGFIFGRSYSQSAIATISQNCFSGKIPSPNTGMLAEAYAQMGYIGIVFFPIIIAFIAKKMKDSSLWYGQGATMVIMAEFSVTAISVQLLTSSTFVGFLIFIVISIVLKKLYEEKTIKGKSTEDSLP